ncbi:MAG: cytochrome c [Myxococcaceae bacterium]|nr:cytochrome c [Myxococcaceae bacterium]
MKRILLGTLAVLVLGLGGGATFLALKKPAQRPAPQLTIEATRERLERGRYLVENVSACLHCHSTPNEALWGTPPKDGTAGAGGFCITPEMGFPGTLCMANITPHAEFGVGRWTDGEILRALREGVDRDGNALMATMPFMRFAHMSDEDAMAVVAYVRTLPAVANAVPEPRLDFPLPLVMKFLPRPLEGGVTAPPRSDTVAHGRYLVTLAGCEECHTPINERHEPLPGRAFAGGQEFKYPWGGSVVTANITPHATGLGATSRADFIARFKGYQGMEPLKVNPRKNTVMPWLSFAGMTEEDLGAIYDYLRTVPPLENVVNPFPDAAGTVASKPE